MDMRATARAIIISLALVAVAGCTPIMRNHGYVPSDAELQEITVGIDSRATVEDVLGTPSAGAFMEGGDIYYVRSQVRHFGMLEPKVIDREIVAISFDGSDVVQNIERFGLEQGRPVVLSRRVTDSSVAGKSFLRQLMGNLGRFNAGEMLETRG
ncbi:outer membrane protein assembly factor BamE [Aquicoccus porphyridii]|uniref:Outer membrane protein assembly factor BamE n=1 Tax=Aquicoccus porphyridii TaxID=1852029 RepID=A0A5A9ZU94_9RHOB|nr:outer membrane protein assembly factor BamE [Aquicoccus porphyridii]RAI56720.1 outer membrane protein assembly factor BamE [Rhodobacteraceae bacterium AsT-22]